MLTHFEGIVPKPTIAAPAKAPCRLFNRSNAAKKQPAGTRPNSWTNTESSMERNATTDPRISLGKQGLQASRNDGLHALQLPLGSQTADFRFGEVAPDTHWNMDLSPSWRTYLSCDTIPIE